LPLLGYIPAALTLASIAFYVVNLVALRLWRRQAVPPPAAFPVSILKPLKGCDPEMYEAFRSHCLQNYEAPYEIIFGVNDAHDEAVPAVERLKKEFPDRAISLVVCHEVLGANRKVSNLVQMVKRAQYAHVLVNDSDITVPPDYLSRVLCWFGDEKVGMVTCLYRAYPPESFWAEMEALGIIADFMPGALTARWLEGGANFGLGSTMAVSTLALDEIGGFESLVDYLADDYQLANAIVNAEYQVAVADVVVETALQEYTFREFWQHQLRWGRTVRASRPGGHFGLIFTFGHFWALLFLIASRLSPAAVAVFLFVMFLRSAVCIAYARALPLVTRSIGPSIPRLVNNLFQRDLLSVVVWFCSIAGNKIVWRGETFRLRNGKLSR
jgi:ceramide glucosyltransferase